jgi:hypothetical protein
VSRADPPPRRPGFSDRLIVLMFLWALAHQQPQSWAADRAHCYGPFRPRDLPSVSQFNRRMNHPRTAAILAAVHGELAGEITATAISYLDGKPLLVGVASKDPDAARGHVSGGFAKGYKLHAWMSEDRRLPVWCVTPLNADERPTARLLVSQADELSARSLTLVDQNFDAAALHQDLAARGGRLLVRPKGAAEHPVTLRQMGAARRELLAVWRQRPGLLKMVHRQRANAEGILGNLCAFGGGLIGLPPWVRRLYRVRRWVGGKIILYHARLKARRSRKQAA